MNTSFEGWWAKLGLFKPSHFRGSNLYLDLDVVVTGEIHSLINQYYSDMTKIWAIDDFSYSLLRPKAVDDAFKETLGGDGTINSSILLWHGDIADRVWNKLIDVPRKKLHGDQNLITQQLWPEHIKLLDSAGVVGSYKYHSGQAFPITVFHGEPKPHDVRDSWVRENWA
jgi:hypothetical protein